VPDLIDLSATCMSQTERSPGHGCEERGSRKEMIVLVSDQYQRFVTHRRFQCFGDISRISRNY